jgi:hypothetical protein
MNAGYRIEPTADKFTVFGPYDEALPSPFKTNRRN